MEILWWSLVIIAFVIAYVGVVAPVVPSTPFLLAGFLVYHFLINPTQLGWGFWITTVLIIILLFVVDHVSSVMAVKKYGGSKWSMIAAIIGGLAFPLFMGPLGLVVGPFALAFLVELVIQQNAVEALRVGWGTLVGFISGIVVKFLVVTGLIIWFLTLVLH